MKNKITTTNLNFQHIPSGMSKTDSSIEFIGNKEDKSVIWLQYGKAKPFNKLPLSVYNVLSNLFYSDKPAVSILKGLYPDTSKSSVRLIEIYTYYMYGQLDNSADVIDGVLQPCENLRETEDCISLNFTNKVIDIDGKPLSNRHLIIIDQFAKGTPDKTIAHLLNISQSTLDFHKSSLYKLLNIQSKPEAVAIAYKNKVVCEA